MNLKIKKSQLKNLISEGIKLYIKEDRAPEPYSTPTGQGATDGKGKATPTLQDILTIVQRTAKKVDNLTDKNQPPAGQPTAPDASMGAATPPAAPAPAGTPTDPNAPQPDPNNPQAAPSATAPTPGAPVPMQEYRLDRFLKQLFS